MNCGNSSNCVRWSYCDDTRTPTSIDFSIVAMSATPF
jgi:hypothetical protein